MRFVDVLTHLHFSFLHIVYHLSTLFEKFLTPQAAGNVPSLIQSVETEEMMNFCLKNDFKPNPLTTYELEGRILGDYILNL